jgi:hypothetical protein
MLPPPWKSRITLRSIRATKLDTQVKPVIGLAAGETGGGV